VRRPTHSAAAVVLDRKSVRPYVEALKWIAL
jgi:hypothetical protein